MPWAVWLAILRSSSSRPSFIPELVVVLAGEASSGLVTTIMPRMRPLAINGNRTLLAAVCPGLRPLALSIQGGS